MPLRGYDIIFRQLWLHQYNLSINWKISQITFPYLLKTDDNFKKRSYYSIKSKYKHKDIIKTLLKGIQYIKEKGYKKRIR